MSRHLRNPYFLFLLPLFFVTHISSENPGLVSFTLGGSIFLEFSLIGLLLSFLFWLIIKDFRKAALVALFIVGFDIFFGSLYDFFNKHFIGAWFLKYTVIIGGTLLIIALLVIYLKWTSKKFHTTIQFLNMLLIILIAIDLVKLATFSTKMKEPIVMDLSDKLVKCDTCNKPDIYLLITDGYAGDTSLREYFNFDNSAFTSALKQRGFYVVNNPRSNYNFTVYTIASMFSMDYIHELDKGKNVTQQDIYLSRDLISKNNFTEYLKSNGYEIQNYSFMNPGGSKSKIRLSYFPPKRALFTSQTFLNRFTRGAGYHFPFYTKLFYSNIRNSEYNNRVMDSLIRENAGKRHPAPRFIFSQLILPHHPYYYDSVGNRRLSLDQSPNVEQEKKDYVQYVVYTNKKLLSLIDHILSNSSRPPIIMLMSDHGYRRFAGKQYNDFQFMTLNTVYMPDSNYAGFYDGMSNVNQMRVLLNSQFRQQLPLLKDSSSFLIEP